MNDSDLGGIESGGLEGEVEWGRLLPSGELFEGGLTRMVGRAKGSTGSVFLEVEGVLPSRALSNY